MFIPEQVKKLVKELKDHIEEESIRWNTLVRYTDVKAKNTFYNFAISV